MPDIIIYDNNCSLYKHLKAIGSDLVNHVGFPVDVFHWSCKHKQSDETCAVHCNPNNFPELIGEDGKSWWFNSSVAEQTNVWLGGFHAILRKMKAEKYDFFLDQMIMLKNELTREKLARADGMPGLVPDLYFDAHVVP